MTRTGYRCDGCGAELQRRDDLTKEPGTTRRRWLCRYCRTTVPPVIAERIQHRER